MVLRGAIYWGRSGEVESGLAPLVGEQRAGERADMSVCGLFYVATLSHSSMATRRMFASAPGYRKYIVLDPKMILVRGCENVVGKKR